MQGRLDLRPPGPVLEISKDLKRAGFEVWCVGGAVRDALLGHRHLDWDLATNATPDQVRTVFGRARTIPVGIAFGTVGVLDSLGVLHEVTTFRRDVRTDGRHAEVEFGASLDEDLARRDFTINAMAYSPSTKELYDPFDGQGDLRRRVVRAVGDAPQRMREDRLRALRALRFAARFEFTIDRATWDAIRQSAPHLTRLSAERVKQELEKTMDQVKNPSVALKLWRDSGALSTLLPELSSVSEEAIRSLDCAARPGLARRPGRLTTRLVLLFSDSPAAQALSAATRLRFSRQESQWIASLVERWHRLDSAIADGLRGPGADPASVRRWIATIGRVHLAAFFRVAAARWNARRALSAAAPPRDAVHSLYRRCLRVAMKEPVDMRDLAVDGDDLRRAGIPPGPELGKILSTLLDLVIEDPSVNTPDRLMDEARRLHVGRS